MSATDIYLKNITARQERAEEELGGNPTMARLLFVMTQSQTDLAPLLAAVDGVIQYLDAHEQANPLGREQWNADIRSAILTAVSKAR